MVKRARGALAALGLLAGALGLAAPTSAAAQAVVIELSTAAPPMTHPVKPGPLIEVVSLASERRRPAAVEAAEIGEVSPVAFTPSPDVTPEAMADLDDPIAAIHPPMQLEARFIATSERRLAELRSLQPDKLDAAVRRLERKGEAQVLAQPRLAPDGNGAASVSVGGERLVEVQDAPHRLAFQAYGAELKLRAASGDGLLRVDLRAEVGAETKSLESSVLSEGQTLVMAAAIPLDPPKAGNRRAAPLGRFFAGRAEPAPPMQLAVIVTAQPRDVAQPIAPLSMDHSPRGPPHRTALAGLAGHMRRLLALPYGGAKAVLTAVGLA